ncbi:MAG TPA: DNA polymerase III subunit beta [Crenotrichaceae bacterium]|nr:DNA polymerase III subunit beta [Crenotrichaceae bacterium]
MKFISSRKDLIEPLSQIVNIIEKRQTMSILANMLVTVSEDGMQMTGTDMELEGLFRLPVDCQEAGSLTLPARKLFDICRLLPDESQICIEEDNHYAKLTSGRSRFKLNTLPAQDYPAFNRTEPDFHMEITACKLKRLFDKPMYAIAQQDVRSFLNGLLLEIEADQIRTVGSDGHRLTLCEDQLEHTADNRNSYLIPRKGVTEFSKLLKDMGNAIVSVEASPSFFTLICGSATISVKLIEEKYPIYQRVIPDSLTDTVTVNTQQFKQALGRVAIMANDRFGRVELDFNQDQLSISSNSDEQEEAEDNLDVDFTGTPFSITFKCSYLTDIANHIESENMQLLFPENKASVLAKDLDDDNVKFVLSPIRV